MTYLEMSEQELRDYVECGGLDDNMFFSLHEEALECIRTLESALRSFVEWETDEAGIKSLLDDEPVWENAERALKSKV